MKRPSGETSGIQFKVAASLFGLYFDENKSRSGSVVVQSDDRKLLPLENAANSHVSMSQQTKEIDPRLLAAIHEFWLTGKVTVDLNDAEMVDLMDSKLEETAALFGLNFHDEPLSGNQSGHDNMQIPINQAGLEKHGDKHQLAKPLRATAKLGSNGRRQLWQFLLLTLLDVSNKDIMAWDGNDGIFNFVNPKAAAELWGRENNKPNMTYNYLVRSLRNYYKDGILAKCKGKNRYKFVCDMELLVGLPLNKLLDAAKARDSRYIAAVNLIKHSNCTKRGQLPT